MPRGRPKKPDVIKKLEGNPGRRPLNSDAPMPAGAPAMPPYLKDYAVEIWDQVITSMPKALYAMCDSAVLGAFCVAVSQHKDATEILESEGLTTTTARGDLRAHPAVAVQNKAVAIMATLGSKLGLDPAARASLKIPSVANTSSKFDGLICLQGKTG